MIRRVETLSIIAAAAMAGGTIALVLLHLLPTGYSPIHDAVSHYAIGRYRALFWTFAASITWFFVVSIELARIHG